MASISIVTRPSKREDGKLPLYLRIHHKNKTRYLSLGIHVYKTHWNDSRSEVRRSHRSYRELNRLLSKARRTGEEALYEMMEEGPPLTSARIRDRVAERLFPKEEDNEKCFVSYCRRLLKTWRGRWAYQTMLAYRTAVNKLEGFAGRPLLFEEVTPGFCRRLQDHIATELGNSLNTQHKNLSALKGFYRQAMKDGVIEWGRNPFNVLTLRKEAGDKKKLTTEELRRLRDVPLEEDSLLADVRRWFFFAFYAGGMRFSDVAELERKHITRSGDEIRARYRMGKTKDMHGVLLVGEAVEILDYYGWEEKAGEERVFPILDGYSLATPEDRRRAIQSRNALVNKYLKKIAGMAGIDKKVSFHLSRHSTAGYLLEQGYDIRTIQRVLGHANVRITENYLKGFESEGPDEAALALGGI